MVWNFLKPALNLFSKSEEQEAPDQTEQMRGSLKRKRVVDEGRQNGSDRKQARFNVTVDDVSQPSTSAKIISPNIRNTQYNHAHRKKEEEDETLLGKVRRMFSRLGNQEHVDTSVFIIDPNSVPYTDNSKEMVKALEKNAIEIDYNQNARFVAAEKLRRERIRVDPTLRDNYASPIPLHPDEVDFGEDAKKMLESAAVNEKKQKMKGFNKKRLTKFSFPTDRPQLGGRRKRIQITSNITGNSNNVLPVFCDVSESKEDVHVPETLTFEYVYENRCDQLGTLEQKLDEDIYKNKCSCHEQTPKIECWENEECPCYQRNKDLMSFQNDAPSPSKTQTKLSSFSPIIMNELKSCYTLGYACSEECSCRGQCNNNAALLHDKKLHSMELERKNAELGFQCASLNYLPPGTVIADMTGEIIDAKQTDPEKDAYVFNINYGDGNGFKNNPLEVIQNATTDLKKEMKRVYKECWNLDAMNIGNVGRMLNHSCEPNVDTVRVFQKGLAPSHMRLLLVTTKPIFPGDEATIDYGENYTFPAGCQCGTMSCENTKVGNFSEDELIAALKNIYTEKYNYYQNHILSKIDN